MVSNYYQLLIHLPSSNECTIAVHSPPLNYLLLISDLMKLTTLIILTMAALIIIRMVAENLHSQLNYYI